MTDDLKKTLWEAANKLRGQMDSAEYKHIVLGLIFLKYVSDAFNTHRRQASNPESEFFVSEDPAKYERMQKKKDYYAQAGVFWVPQKALWESLQKKAKQPHIGRLIDEALAAIENENPVLKNTLDKRFGRAQLDPGILGELIDLISTIGFTKKDGSIDLLGEIYEYFLGQFASAEGKKGGEFYTPACVVKTLVAVLSPHKGKVYDPCCGSGGMFVQSEEFVEAHGGARDDISIFGQESNPTTWRLVAMNLAIRGISADLGEPADTFAADQFPQNKFDYILANPPFNISDWGGEKYENNPRWEYGHPPTNNANYAWLQHILWKLARGGRAGVVLANGSMSSQTGGEGKIRGAMIKDDVVEIMVALPGQLFLNTQIPACLWFMTHNKGKDKNARYRRGETLFIDARQLGTMQTRVLKTFSDEDIARISDTVEAWRAGKKYKDIPGFCKSASLKDIEENGFVLTPGRYVGIAPDEEDSEPFIEKMQRLIKQWHTLKKQGAALDKKIARNFKHLNIDQ